MTTSDLSDQTKPWESAVKVSDLLYQEFFSQGEMVSNSLSYTIDIDYPIVSKLILKKSKLLSCSHCDGQELKEKNLFFAFIYLEEIKAFFLE